MSIKDHIVTQIQLSCEGNCSETMEILETDFEMGEGLGYYIQFRIDTF